MNLFRVRQETRRRATQAFRFTLGQVGRGLPLSLKKRLAKRSTKLGYLLVHDGDLMVPDYLGEYRVWANARQAAERAMLFGSYDEELAHVARRYIQEGDTVLDIGANVGATALLLAKCVGEKGRVHCFEPGPHFAKRLKANIALNPGLEQRIHCHQVGLAQSHSVLRWAEDPLFPGNGFFGKKGMEIPVVPLDAYAPTHSAQVTFVKIDVEGMEYEVLAGATAFLKRNRPVVFFETHMDFETYLKRPVRRLAAELLIELGYSLHRITPKGVPVKCEYPHFGANTLALPSTH